MGLGDKSKLPQGFDSKDWGSLAVGPELLKKCKVSLQAYEHLSRWDIDSLLKYQVSTNMLDVLVYFFKLHIPIIVIYIVVLCNIVKNKKWDVSETSEWCQIFFIINPPKKIYFY